ncbi:MAG: hypothetical protein SGARI_005669, partial [Bacillariaceae sp.]
MSPFDPQDDNASHGSLGTETSSNPRLEDMCRARDEADRLREEVCRLRERLEGVEEERNFHAAKANELMSLLTNGRGDAAQEELVKKTMQVAELNVQVQRLGADKEEMAQENARTRKELQDLSAVVRSLQNSASYSSDEEEHFDEDEEDEEEVELTAEKALDMTLSNMKAHIE